MKSKVAGFTLIEILIVIAIVGVLASVVLAALASSRKKGSDSVVKSQLNQMATQMEVYSIDNNNYGSVYATALCPTASDPSIFYSNPQIRTGIGILNAQDNNLTKCAAGTPSATGNATSWAIAAPVTYSTQYWCVDSTGSAKLSEESKNIFMRLIALITPRTFAASFSFPGPSLGGGFGAAAVCPDPLP